MADQAKLSSCLAQTVNPDAGARKQAEAELEQFKRTPSAAITVLHLLTAETLPAHVRQAGAVYFKNMCKQHWDAEASDIPIGEPVKQQVRDGLLPLFLVVPESLQAQLSEAISIIATHDFPKRWEGLLPALVQQAGAALGAAPKDYRKGAALLQIGHSIFRRYRHEFKSDDLFREIKYVLDLFQAPLLCLFQSTLADLPGAQAAAECRVVLETVTKLVAIAYDLCAQDLPEYFEDHLSEWMSGFVDVLKYSNPALAVDEDETEPAPTSVAQAEVVETLALFMSKYEEEFAPFLGVCLGHVWALLTSTSLAPHFDLLVTTSIRFLTTVASSVHHHHFAQAEVLLEVCQKIIAPNMALLSADEDLFDENPFEYVRKDIEGSDADTRRRVSVELVRGLCRNYETQVTQLFSTNIRTLLDQYAADTRGHWKSKDVAFYLVIALTLKGGTSKLGATQTNALVDLLDFYTKHVAPELAAAAGGAAPPHPVLIADAVKFVTVFRAQLPRGVYDIVLPMLVALLDSPNLVVHTYAAAAIERMLTVRELAPPGAPPGALGERRFGARPLSPLLEPLLTKLFGLLQLRGSEENAHVMRAIMRVTVVAEGAMAPYVTVCVEALKSILARVCSNPSNPTFNHFLFETVASLVKHICAVTPAAVNAFEQLLFPPFQTVLQMDIAEFTPYVFQVLAQLLEARDGLSAAYEALFPPLLTPAMWERPGNVPPLVRLLCAYASKGKPLVLSKLEMVLGVFQKLLARGATDAHAARLLSALWRSCDLAELGQYATPIFDLCVRRAQGYKKVGTALVATWSVFVARYGAPALRAQLEAVQPGLAAMVLRGLWAEYAPHVKGVVERKAAVIGSVRLVAEVPEVARDADTAGTLLSAACGMVLADAGVAMAPEPAATAYEEEDGIDVDTSAAGAGGYNAAYVQLSFAAEAETDLYAEHGTAAYLARALAQMGARQPELLQAVAGRLPADKQQELQKLMAAAA